MDLFTTRIARNRRRLHSRMAVKPQFWARFGHPYNIFRHSRKGLFFLGSFSVVWAGQCDGDGTSRLTEVSEWSVKMYSDTLWLAGVWARGWWLGQEEAHVLQLAMASWWLLQWCVSLFSQHRDGAWFCFFPFFLRVYGCSGWGFFFQLLRERDVFV